MRSRRPRPSATDGLTTPSQRELLGERLELLVARYVGAHGIEGTFSAERIPPEAARCHLALLEWWYDGGELSIGDQDRLRRFIAFMRSDATERPTIEQQRVDARAARLAASRRDRESR